MSRAGSLSWKVALGGLVLPGVFPKSALIALLALLFWIGGFALGVIGLFQARQDGTSAKASVAGIALNGVFVVIVLAVAASTFSRARSEAEDAKAVKPITRTGHQFDIPIGFRIATRKEKNLVSNDARFQRMRVSDLIRQRQGNGSIMIWSPLDMMTVGLAGNVLAGARSKRDAEATCKKTWKQILRRQDPLLKSVAIELNDGFACQSIDRTKATNGPEGGVMIQTIAKSMGASYVIVTGMFDAGDDSGVAAYDELIASWREVDVAR